MVGLTLKQVGAYIAKAQLADALKIIVDGDGNMNDIIPISVKTAGTLTYEDLIALWASFDGFELNRMIVAPDVMMKMLAITELRNPQTGLNFQATGCLSTPLGAKLYRSAAVPAGSIIGLDKNYALEMITAGDVTIESDKLIDRQLERTAITSTAGFAKIFTSASQQLKVTA